MVGTCSRLGNVVSSQQPVERAVGVEGGEGCTGGRKGEGRVGLHSKLDRRLLVEGSQTKLVPVAELAVLTVWLPLFKVWGLRTELCDLLGASLPLRYLVGYMPFLGLGLLLRQASSYHRRSRSSMGWGSGAYHLAVRRRRSCTAGSHGVLGKPTRLIVRVGPERRVLCFQRARLGCRVFGFSIPFVDGSNLVALMKKTMSGSLVFLLSECIQAPGKPQTSDKFSVEWLGRLYVCMFACRSENLGRILYILVRWVPLDSC
jgi:hypothetical protein